jgi:hypothetical protein
MTIQTKMLLLGHLWVSVASAIAGVFANFPNKIAIITEEFEDVDNAKSRGVVCQH